jgi:hypothetical protein
VIGSDLLGSKSQNLKIGSVRARFENNVIGSDRFGKKPDLIGLLGPARYFRADILARTPIPGRKKEEKLINYFHARDNP